MAGQRNEGHRSSLEVLYEDNHLIVVNKPPLIPTMGAERGQESMVDRVKDYLRHRYNKPGNVYLGVVSRLDAFTRGVLIFARTSKAASRLAGQFREGTVDKQYLAIVEAELDEASGVMQDFVAKDDDRRRMFVTKAQHPGAREAELHWRRLGRSKEGETLVEIRLVTGRKHQIRVQFSSRGWPVRGDRKYGGRQPGEGIALLAKSLSLIHPVRNEPMTFEVGPPEDWKIHRFGDN